MNAIAKWHSALIVISLLAVSLSSCNGSVREDPRGLTALVSVEGSNTMTALMQDWAKAFMATHAGVPVSITSDDSGSGIDALINRTTDLATSSRDLTGPEIKLIAERGEHLKKVTVACDAIVVLVNPENPVSQLTLAQIRSIFTGSKRNWQDFGGPNQQIRLFSREKESGTYTYFLQHALKGEPYGSCAKVLPSTEAITEAVEKERWSIAYEGLAEQPLPAKR